MKKFLAILLVLCMVMSSVVIVSAEGAADFTKTKKKAEFTYTKGQAVTAGAIMFNPTFDEGETVNLNDYKYVDIAIYAYNAAAIGGTLMQFEMTSSGQADVEENCYSVNLGDMGLVNGWNVVRVPVEKWMSGPAKVDAINFWRYFSATMYEATDDAFLKIYSVTLTNNEAVTATPEIEVTLPDFVPPEVKEPVYVETTYTVEFNKTFEVGAGAIQPGVQVNINQVFDPQDMTDVAYVELHVDVTNAAQFSEIEFQFELTSGGACDAYENNYTGMFDNLKDGKNVIKVPIEKFTGVVSGGFDLSKINYLRLYSQAGSVTQAFTAVIEKVVFVNPKNMPTPNYETGATGNEYGEKDIIVVSNCEDGTGFQNGEATTEIVNRGTGAQKWAFAAGEVPFPSCMFTYLAAEPVNTTGMNRFAFDFYVNNAAALKDVTFYLELTSGGTCDKEEFCPTHTFAELTETKELVDGWNTCYIDIEGAGGCDFTRWNYFRFFQTKAFNTPTDLVMCIDNVRFVNYVSEPADVVEGVEVQQFKVFNEATENLFLVRTNAGNNGTQRFSDGNFETVYKFTVKNRYNVNKVVFKATTNAQLLLQVSQDDATWKDVFVYEYDPNGNPDQGLPKKEREFDLTEFVNLEAANTIYIRIADSEPSNGWGGGIFPDTPATLTVEYTPLTKEELDAKEAWADANSIPLLGFNKAFGGMTLDTEDCMAGSGSNVFKLGTAPGAAFTPIDGTGMDTLTFDLYISDLALFDVKFGNTGLELTSSGGYDKSEISWNLAGIRDNNLGGELKAGWNHIILPLETASNDDRGDGPFDISKINFFRLFMVSPEGGEGIVVKIDNMRLDNSGIERAAAQLAIDQEAADKVIKLINDIGEVTIDSEKVIVKAENAYKKLSATQKDLVTNKDALKAAREAYDALVAAQTPDDPVDTPDDPVDTPDDPVDTPDDPVDTPDDPVDTPDTPDEPANNNTVVIIIVVVAVVVIAAAVCVYFFVLKKKK